MQDGWWSLPGPLRFVEAIERDLRNGRNVVVSLPRYAPGNLRSAVRARLRDDWAWTTLYADEGDRATPLDVLFSRCASSVATETRRTAAAFAERDIDDARIVWVDGVDAQLWPAWHRFLTDYEQACRAVPEHRRTLLCVARGGDAAVTEMDDDVCLAEHRYFGRVTDLDMLLFTSLRLSSAELAPALRRLLVTMIARLALWDPELAIALADLPPEEVLDPVPALREFAVRREWGQAQPPSWHAGTLEEIDGRKHAHAAMIALADVHSEIARRIWSAQVEVLFPWVEEQRRELIYQLPGVLRVPFTRGNGEVIKDVSDLEIGVVWHQLRDTPGVGDDKRRLARLLRDVRNCLSHLEPLTAELALRACRS